MMFLGPWHIMQALLFALGVYWCYEVIGRWQEDLIEFREVEDKIRKVVIVGIWVVTVIIAIFLVRFTYGLISRIIPGIRSLIQILGVTSK